MITETGEQVRKFIAYLPTKPRGCVSSEFMICDYNPIELLPEVFILTEIAHRCVFINHYLVLGFMLAA